MSALPPAEIERRAPLWRALSGLFLDTQITEIEIAHIAREIRKAGISAAEAERVLRREVAPAFYPNLLSGAGAWAPWPADFVCARVVRHAASPKLLPALGARLAWAMIRKDWARVRAALEANDAG